MGWLVSPSRVYLVTCAHSDASVPLMRLHVQVYLTDKARKLGMSDNVSCLLIETPCQ